MTRNHWELGYILCYQFAAVDLATLHTACAESRRIPRSKKTLLKFFDGIELESDLLRRHVLYTQKEGAQTITLTPPWCNAQVVAKGKLL
jgi:hypothetical protein